MYNEPRKFNYVILIASQHRFVTSLDNATKTAKWEKGEEAKIFTTKKVARSIADALMCNGYDAFVVDVPATYPAKLVNE